jgi:rhodanese-related sulfurtransferase
MLVIQQTDTGYVSASSSRHPVFSWRMVIKDCLYFLTLAILLGGIWNYSLLFKAFNGTLITNIQQNQLAALKSKAAQLYPGISFIDLVSAKKLFDDRLAIFVDARVLQEYETAHISGAISLPVREFLIGEIDPGKTLPDRETVLITYCDGGECEIALDVAKDLSEHGYHNIFVLGEGYPGWEAAGYPVDKQELKP